MTKRILLNRHDQFQPEPGKMSRRWGSLGILVAAGAALVGTPLLAAGFGRVANQPWSGGVTIYNQFKTPKAEMQVTELQTKDVRATKILEKNQSPIFDPSKKGPKPPTKPSAPSSMSVNLAPIINAKWQAARPKLIADTQAYLNEKDIGGGWRTSKNTLFLAESGPMFIGSDGSGFTVRFQLPGNSLKTWLRTPIGVSESADPGFIVSFDLDVTINLELRGNRLVAGPAQMKANVKPPVGTNATGKAAVAASNFIKGFLGGPDFIGKMLAMVNNRQFSFDTGINQELAKFNPILDKAAGSAATIQPGYDSGSQSATLTLVNKGPEPVLH